MPSPFIAQGGRIRRSPLVEAVASSSKGNSNVTANRSPGNVKSGSGPPGSTQPLGDPNNPTNEDINNALTLAEAGDQTAVDWLKVAGVVGGVAGVAAGGYALTRALRNRGSSKNGAKAIGADNITIDAQTKNASTAVAKKVQKPDLYIDLPPEAVRVVEPRLPTPVKQLPKFDPQISSQAMKAIRILP